MTASINWFQLLAWPLPETATGLPERGVLDIMHGRSPMTIDPRGRGVLVIMHCRSRMTTDPEG